MHSSSREQLPVDMHFSKNNCAQQHKKYTESSKIKVMATPAINGGRGVRRQRGVGVGDPFNLSNLTTGANVSKRRARATQPTS